jgi:hypothetical protein
LTDRKRDQGVENVVAFSYTLDIATSDSPLCVAEKLVHVTSAAQLLQSPPPPAADLLTEGISTAHGIRLRVLAEDDEPDPEDPLVENLGFTPTTTVIFRYKKGAYEEQDEDVVLLSSRLLEEVPGMPYCMLTTRAQNSCVGLGRRV